MAIITSLGLIEPDIGSTNWGQPTNANWTLLNNLLSGIGSIFGLDVNGNVTINGTLTATYITGLIPTGVVVVPFSSIPTFDASKGLEFKITLTGNVTNSVFSNGNIGPSIIVIRIVQDSTGNRTFMWPTNIRNAGVISPAANSRSLQIFAIDTDGSADAIGPMMYS